MAFPATPLDVEVSLALSADLSDPDSWTWTDITDYVREGSRIHIRRGRTSERSTIGPSRCTLAVDNTDGRFCRFLPTGAWYGQIGPNTPIRVRVDVGSGYVTRFVGYVSGWPPTWDPSEQDQTVQLVADGILRRLGQGRVLRSALYRSMTGVSAGGYSWNEYWPLEDGANATRFASAVGGAPMVVRQGVVPSTDSTLPGSDALPELTEAANVSAGATVRTYTDQGQWVCQFMAKVPDDGGPTFNTLLTVTTSPAVSRYVQVGVGPSGLILQIYSDAGADSGGWADAFDTSRVYGQWCSFVLSAENDASGTTDRMSVSMYDTSGDLIASISELVGVGYYGTVRRLDLNGVTGVGGGAGEAHYGHLGFNADPAWTVGVDDVFLAQAAGGWAGEMAHERVERLGREEGIPVTVTATESQAMGPQRSNTAVALFRECATTDFGLLYEPADAAGLAFLSSSERYNLASAITLQYDQGHISPPWDPTDDDRDTRNDVTASRPSGSSARVTDEASITAIGVYSDSISANTQTDEQLDDVAGWAVNLGTVDELRWPAVKLNLLGHPSLIGDWMAADLGSQLSVTGHPSPLAPDEIVQVLEGYDETLGSFEYTAVANLSPASGWIVGEYDDDDLGKLDTAGCVMQAGATSGATSFTVATTVLPRWTTDAGEMPIPILVSGQVNSVTAIANVSPSFVAAGTVAHANNASVTPTMPAGVQAGDLLLVLAAIRNSGTGTVDTPSGYTVLLTSGNMTLLGKVHTGTESAPTITFTGGVANADTSAQMAAFRGTGITVHASEDLLNSSAQNVTYPALDISRDNCAVLYLGWKQDDWTSVASPGTEIGEPDTTTGDDQGIVWAYTLQTTATAIASGTFTVTGGASAISRGAVIALATDVQTMTVTRGTNGVTKSIPIGSQVNVYRPARLAL